MQCYGHVSTDVSTPPGGDYLERGSVTCRPAEWVFESGLGPEAMFFKPQTGAEFEIWAVSFYTLFSNKTNLKLFFSGITMNLTFHGLNAVETSGTNRMIWELATVFPTRDTMAVVMHTVLEPSPVMDAKYKF